MSQYTAEQVNAAADIADNEYRFHIAASMLRELASRLRQEKEENRRDPVKEPVSVDGSFGDDPDDHAFAITWDKPLPFNTGDRVRVVKIEETT